MGMCYSVDVNVSYKDTKNFIELGNRYIDEEISKGAKFDREDEIDRSTVDGIWEMIIVKRGITKESDGKYTSDFDANYSWEILMKDFFFAIAPSLNDGSTMDIWPDDDYCRLEVKDGAVFEHWSDADEEG